MGKDSLLKSTSKKSPAKSEQGEKKKPRPKTTLSEPKAVSKPPKTKVAAAPRKVARKSTPSKKSAAARKGSGAKTRTVPRSAARKAGSAARKDTKPMKLVLKQFDRWKPEKPFKVDPKKRQRQIPPAPPYISGKDGEDSARIRALLFKKFDLSGRFDKPQPADRTKDADPMAAPPATSPPPVLPPAAPTPDPAVRTIFFLAAGIIILLGMVVAASISNSSHYYLKAENGAVAVWRGTFAPLGQEKILVLPGSQAPAAVKAVYTKNEIFSHVFNYYLNKADTLLDATAMPDFEGIKLYLNKARAYAVNERQLAIAASRINTIDLMTYLYKADVAASKGTLEDYQVSLDYLNKAAALKLDSSQTELVKKKIQSLKDLVAGLKAAPEAGAAAPPETPAKPSAAESGPRG